nr:hypothetical protein [Tanacetum cinerariifolium]
MMIPSKGLEGIKELSRHSFSWHNEGDAKGSKEPGFEELNVMFEELMDFEQNMKFVNEEVLMSQHKFDTLIKGRIANLEETLNKLIRESSKKQKKKIVQNKNSGCLPSATKMSPRGLAHVITTKSSLNYKPLINPLDNFEGSNNVHEISPNKDKKDKVEVEKAVEESVGQKKVVESYVPPIPFPRRLKKEKEIEQFIKFLENLQQQSTNISFIEALEQMPKYAKLDLRELKTTRSMCIEQANKTTQYPKGIAKNVIIQINKFVFPVDFVILDVEEDSKAPIILGQPFLATTHAMIDF